MAAAAAAGGHTKRERERVGEARERLAAFRAKIAWARFVASPHRPDCHASSPGGLLQLYNLRCRDKIVLIIRTHGTAQRPGVIICELQTLQLAGRQVLSHASARNGPTLIFLMSWALVFARLSQHLGFWGGTIKMRKLSLQWSAVRFRLSGQWIVLAVVVFIIIQWFFIYLFICDAPERN